MEVEASSANGHASNGEASTAAESSTKNQQITELAANLLVQGRRHLLVSDIPSAIAALAESSRLLVELYGEFADEVADSYYYYGMALLEMARTDSDVLGDAVEGGEKAEEGSSEEDEGEDDSEEEEEEGTAPKENGDAKNEEKTNGHAKDSSHTNGKDSKTTNGDVEMSTKPADEKKASEEIEAKEKSQVESGDKAEAASEKKPAADQDVEKVVKPKESKGKSLKAPGAASIESKGEAEPAEEETGDGEVSNLQLAWEIFELAKNIYKRRAQADETFKPKLADALIRLAEVAIESENYTSAIEDLQKCLEIQLASFPSDSRSLAETYYQLGVAYTFTTDFKEAVKSFESAAGVIKLRIENLKNPAEKKPSMEEPKSVFHTIEGEIEELESLLPDIREKIDDTIDMEKEAARKMAENGTASSINGDGPAGSSKGEDISMANGDSATDSSKPALDITHLIRKKRKPEDEATEAPEAEASASKKVCADAVA